MPKKVNQNQDSLPQNDKDKRLEQYLAYGFGLVFIIVVLILALAIPKPEPFQFLVFKIILALAAAGIAAFIPGFLHVQVSTIVRAGGAIAVFVIVFFFNPADLVKKEPPPPTPTPTPISTASTTNTTSQIIDVEIPISEGSTLEESLELIASLAKSPVKIKSTCSTSLMNITLGKDSVVKAKDYLEAMKKLPYFFSDFSQNTNYNVQMENGIYEVSCENKN